MSKYKPYPAYKDSGVEWIGEVPEHWSVKRIEHIAFTHRENITAEVLNSYEVLHYSIPSVQETGAGTVELGTTIDSNKLVVSCEQVLISKLNPRKGTVVIAKKDPDRFTVASTEFVPLIPKYGESISKFIASMVASAPFKQLIESRVESVTRSHQRVSPDEILKARVTIPPFEEQIAIAAAIDRETARIDALIDKKTQFIALLKEKRQALITHAVTKGLDPNVKMKDSGVEWIGKVPEGWNVLRVARLGVLNKSNGGTKQDNIDYGVPCVRYGDLYTKHNYFIRQTSTFIADSSVTDYTSIRYGDVLFASSGETFEDIGKSAVNLISGVTCCGGDVIVLRPLANNDPLFLGYALDCSLSRAQKAGMGKGYTVIHVYVEQLRNLMVTIPSQKEQEVIAAYLDSETARIDTLITKTQLSIDLLKERRSAFITAAVTGKIDLRESK